MTSHHPEHRRRSPQRLASPEVAGWISVRNWRRFQHYDPAKRQPPWIKVYTELMSDPAYLSLTGHERGVLHGIWLEYAASRCQLPLDARSMRARSALGTLSLSRRLALRVSSHTLKRLCDAGFIEIVASKELAEGYHDASPRAHAKRQRQRQTEISISLPELQDVGAAQPDRGNGWVDNLASYTGCRYVRGDHGLGAVYDPLGTEPPPRDWPHPRPTREEILQALAERRMHRETA